MQPPRRQDATQANRQSFLSKFSLASRRLGGFVFFFAISGCVAHSSPQLPPPAQPAISADAAPSVDPAAIHVEMYRLQMPFGANSLDDSFWKLVDEDAIDVDAAQNLNRNGFRVGRARIDNWPAFLKILTGESAIKLSKTIVLAPPSFEDGYLPMSDTLPEELFFIYDDHGLTMRSFDDCRNMLSMAFEWVPRKPGTIRLTICPMVQATQTRLDYSLSDNPPPVRCLQRETFYDLHLRADIAPGEFLVVGTSAAAQDPNRVASRFLQRDGPNQRFEQVLIFVGDPGPLATMKFHRAKPTTR
jgi:hypothetical protein